jgi:hypothetical protein
VKSIGAYYDSFARDVAVDETCNWVSDSGSGFLIFENPLHSDQFRVPGDGFAGSWQVQIVEFVDPGRRVETREVNFVSVGYWKLLFRGVA